MPSLAQAFAPSHADVVLDQVVAALERLEPLRLWTAGRITKVHRLVSSPDELPEHADPSVYVGPTYIEERFSIAGKGEVHFPAAIEVLWSPPSIAIRAGEPSAVTLVEAIWGRIWEAAMERGRKEIEVERVLPLGRVSVLAAEKEGLTVGLLIEIIFEWRANLATRQQT